MGCRLWEGELGEEDGLVYGWMGLVENRIIFFADLKSWMFRNRVKVSI